MRLVTCPGHVTTDMNGFCATLEYFDWRLADNVVMIEVIQQFGCFLVTWLKAACFIRSLEQEIMTSITTQKTKIYRNKRHEAC